MVHGVRVILPCHPLSSGNMAEYRTVSPSPSRVVSRGKGPWQRSRFRVLLDATSGSVASLDDRGIPVAPHSAPDPVGNVPGIRAMFTG